MSEGLRAVPDQLPLTHSSAGADRQRLCLKPPATCHQSSQKNQEIQKKPKIGKTQGGEKKKSGSYVERPQKRVLAALHKAQQAL